MATIKQTHDKFLLACDENEKYAYNGQELYSQGVQTGPIIFDKNMRDLVVEYSFMKLFLCWEDFLEKVFVKYCLDFEGANGNKLIRYVNPRDEIHAYEMIRGNNSYPDWTNTDKIIKTAGDFFENGGTFLNLKLKIADINDTKIIRNALSHMSINSKQKFETLVRTRHGHYPLNTTPADFLTWIDRRNRTSPITYFNHYVATLKFLSTEIVNP
ncbi:hypothetical protein PP175_01585 [Aneurinibacillus sp. Ricciae_BoGa-3]|uniref:hypothetical protein n=1 Tax=Aneurinibacillus sp. Ricciae_BoGa-3 TaxID=3022697 RepID=UPI0023416C06|nr:hypothetical protein [Aneurinibacillus sp. Ricciae_BoGa-3]WCK54757.1 hypothetical protein PP175_01585 [Aneurinibacillus sp. Ricciae_BoGa-3]